MIQVKFGYGDSDSKCKLSLGTMKVQALVKGDVKMGWKYIEKCRIKEMNICQNLIIWSYRIESKKLQSAHQDRKMCTKFRTKSMSL